MFTIGEFSKLSHISARMLRHYDKLGLLRPAFTGEDNGYRYYDSIQLPVLMQIERLKGYGFTLAEIRELLPLSQQELGKAILNRRRKAHVELNELKRRLRQMEEDIIKMEGMSMSMEKYHVIVMETPAQRVFGLRRTINIEGVHELFADLYEEIARRGLKQSGATQTIFRGEEFSYELMDLEAQIEVSGEDPDIQVIPAQTCAAVTHVGPYEGLQYAYDAICTWMAEHVEYEVCGPAIERYLKDEDEVQSPEELETGVLFPIKKIK